MDNEQLIETVREAGVKAGQASKHQDWATVRYWKQTLDSLEATLKDAGIDAHAIYQEAYRQGSGFYDNKFTPFN